MMARGISEKMSHFRNTLFMGKHRKHRWVPLSHFGFDINRKWDNKTLHNEISRLLPAYVEIIYFEILKNSGGTLIRPNLPAGKDIDAKLLLKSIADPSGWVHLRMLGELLDSFMDPSDKKTFSFCLCC